MGIFSENQPTEKCADDISWENSLSDLEKWRVCSTTIVPISFIPFDDRDKNLYGFKGDLFFFFLWCNRGIVCVEEHS